MSHCLATKLYLITWIQSDVSLLGYKVMPHSLATKLRVGGGEEEGMKTSSYFEGVSQKFK